jgi:hypothetical protein
MCPAKYPQYFKNLNTVEPTITALIETGLLFAVPKRDRDGTTIAIYRPKVIDPKLYKPDDCFRFEIAVIECWLMKEEYQIGGTITIYDFTDFPKQLLTFLTFSHYRDMIYLLANVLPLRLKAFYVIGLPAFATNLFEWGTGFMHLKLRDRLKFIKNYEHLKKFFDIEYFPVEYGGKITMEENIEYVKETMLKHRECISLINDIDADFDCEDIEQPSPKIVAMSSASGRFKKLEID